MPQQTNIKQWTCTCSTANPLRKRRCTNCGREMPKSFLNEIYKAEIEAQSSFFKNLRRENEIRRCRKIGETLAKRQTVMVIVLIVASLACNAARFFRFPEQIKDCSETYALNRADRFDKEGDQVIEHFTGLQELPFAVIDFGGRTGGFVHDVVQGLTEIEDKYYIAGKIDHIKEKLERIIEKIYPIRN